MRIPSGTTDQYIYFVARDSTDFTTRETGLSSFTVYRSRNGAAAAAMTTPTVNETDATNMPGVYELLLDEDMTIAAGNTEEEMVFHITATNMDPVTRSITLFRPVVTEGNTLGVASDGDISGNVDGSVATLGSGAIVASSFGADSITNNAIASAAITPTEATVNVTQISGDSSAADNLEAAYDGTGYVGGSIRQAVDMVAISGDTVAADNLESYCDGTTPQPVNVTQVSGDGPAADNLESAYDGTGYAGGTTKQQVDVVSMATDVITAAALSAAAVTKITDDVMADVIETEGSYTVQQALSVILAVLAGETSGSGNTISTPNGNATRVAATTDASNNRTAMTITPSA